MSEVKKTKSNASQNIPHSEKQIPEKVVSINSHKCVHEDCKALPKRAGFCDEHYLWFKEGLITLDGFKAKDFEKKYHRYIQKKSA